MKLRLTPRAGHDIREISRYLRDQNPAAASRVRSAILETMRILLEFPGLGHAQTETGVRKSSRENTRISFITGWMKDAMSLSFSLSSILHGNGLSRTNNQNSFSNRSM